MNGRCIGRSHPFWHTLNLILSWLTSCDCQHIPLGHLPASRRLEYRPGILLSKISLLRPERKVVLGVYPHLLAILRSATS